MSTPNTTPSSPLNSTVHFFIQAENDPASLSRVLELFAMRNITPNKVRSSKFRDGNLSIDVSVCDLNDHEKNIIHAKLHEQVLVHTVRNEVILPVFAKKAG